MKSIREKAKEAERNTLPLFESIRESTGEPVSVYDQNDMIDMFEQGANYVLEEIERIVNSAIENKSMTIPTWRLNYIIKQLKK